jgi:hypothetical protein
MAAVLETRLRQAQTEKLAPIDLVSTLVSDAGGRAFFPGVGRPSSPIA